MDKIFNEVQKRLVEGHTHSHMVTQTVTGNHNGHNHPVQMSITDPQESLKALCEVMEEEMSNLSSNISQIAEYLVKKDDSLMKNFVDEKAAKLLGEARDEIIRLKSLAGFLTEDDMKIK